MATPTSVSSSANTGTRWGRSGEPGSAFSGLSSRGGRGGRGRGGPRGGRGGGRTTISSHKDSKPDDNHRQNTKFDNSQHLAPSVDKASPSTPAPIANSDPPSTSSSSSKPKPPSRRASRAIPPDINSRVPFAVVTPAPASAKPSSRRRRSQANKPPPNKIDPPAPNDDLLRPNKPRLTPVPHTAPIKDTPPHLSQRTGIRNDIDALVERVRAVAMENNRPSTPGSHSHIDWAGDDDDTLPDLDDWGVTTATFSSSKSDVISPLIVGSLKSLPDVVGNSFPSSPLKQPATIAERHDDSLAAAPPVSPTDSAKLEVKAGVSTSPPKETELELNRRASPISTKPSIAIQDPRRKMPLHPSLPAKPVTAPPNSQSRARSNVAPMRKYPKSPITPAKDSFDSKGPETEHSSELSAPSKAPNEEVRDLNSPLDATSTSEERTPHAPKSLTVSEPTVPVLEVQPSSEVPQHQPKGDAKPEDDDYWSREGLSASIHAPKAISDSVSAPATIASYPNLPSERVPTHARTQTVGRPFPKPSQNEYIPRFTRSGHTTPRSAFHGQQHIRTQSTPPTGVISNQQRAHRPIITGDAISRLARTIGKTGISNAANAKAQPVGSPGH